MRWKRSGIKLWRRVGDFSRQGSVQKKSRHPKSGFKVAQVIELARSGFKTSDHVREQGVPRIENGAYT